MSNTTYVSPLWLLTLLFIGLKLTGYIAWSWWWVLSPTLIPLGIALGLMAFAGILWCIVMFFMLCAGMFRRGGL